MSKILSVLVEGGHTYDEWIIAWGLHVGMEWVLSPNLFLPENEAKNLIINQKKT